MNCSPNYPSGISRSTSLNHNIDLLLDRISSLPMPSIIDSTSTTTSSTTTVTNNIIDKKRESFKFIITNKRKKCNY